MTRHLDRGERSARAAVPELTVGVLAPAVDRLFRTEGTGVIEAGTDRAEPQAPGDRRRGPPRNRAAVAQLAHPVIAPAVGSPFGGDRAGVPLAGVDGGETKTAG